jgi:hypothetical protein
MEQSSGFVVGKLKAEAPHLQIAQQLTPCQQATANNAGFLS